MRGVILSGLETARRWLRGQKSPCKLGIFLSLMLLSCLSSPVLAQPAACNEIEGAQSYQEILDSDDTPEETKKKLSDLDPFGKEVANYLDFLSGLENASGEAEEASEFLRDFRPQGVINLNRLELALLVAERKSASDRQLFLSRYITLRNLLTLFCNEDDPDIQFLSLSLTFQELQQPRSETPSREYVRAARELAQTGALSNGLEPYSSLLSETFPSVREDEFEWMYEITRNEACRDRQHSDCLSAFEDTISVDQNSSTEALLEIGLCVLKLVKGGKTLSVNVCELQLSR
ncbi:hypothetical protein [Roseibium marinum]|uniref:Uncharacterized protein n=1 Tax=Roseibium marinum TaxID=281252 RepID=A0A2S3V4E8_9HYPH|nr:hypothetical protein [Roseibium marinum]POF34653.1 hypothetical protein CLV41_1011110 [Roseibium marinum]